MLLGSVNALLMLLLCSAAHCALFEPKGGEVTDADEIGFSFSMGYPFKLFGHEFGEDVTNYVARATGRIAIGSSKYSDIPVFNPGEETKFNLLQPLEFYNVVNLKSYISVSRLHQEKISSDHPLLTEFTNIVKENFWDQKQFQAEAGFLVTWVGQRDSKDPTGKDNNFQAAIVVGAGKTFVVYNYAKLTFLQLKEKTDPVRAGFTKLNSNDMMSLPFKDANVGQLATASGIGGSEGTGRFVYRVDNWPPVRGGCLSADPPQAADRVLSSSVSRESVLGGSFAILSSVCHDGTQSGTCTVKMNGQVIGSSDAVVCPGCGNVFLTCELPASLREGTAQLMLKIGSSENEYSQALEYQSPDAEIGPRLKIIDEDKDEFMKINAQNLRMSFDPTILNGTRTLEIIGYSEDGAEDLSTPENAAKLFATLATQEIEASNTGNLNLNSMECENNCDKFHIGYVKISDQGNPKTVIRSKILPLGWLVRNSFSGSAGAWSAAKCKAWSDRNDAPWDAVRKTLQDASCPCTLDMALAETSRLLPSSYCPLLGGNCASAQPEQQCFVSRMPAKPDMQGAPAAMCCYHSTQGHLLLQDLNDGSDPKLQGSSSFRSHPDGVPTSANLLPGQVSYMSHWYWDTLNSLYCCRWSNSGTCPMYYMQRRPTPKCSSFKLGRSSFSVGDPHLRSYSGRPFLFNHLGEYWLVRSTKVAKTPQVQGRFLAQNPRAHNFTLLTAVAFQAAADGAIFEVNFRPFVVRRRQDGEQPTVVSVSEGNPHVEAGVTLVMKTTTNLMAQLQGEEGAVGVDLHAESSAGGFANLHVSLSDSMKEKTRGLLGRWTDNVADEFTAADEAETVVPFNSNWQEWNTQFCDKNRIGSHEESFFNYEVERTDGFRRINRDQKNQLRPIYSTDSLSPPGNEADVCGDDADCQFDLRAAAAAGIENPEALARSTRTTGSKFAAWQVTDNTSVAFCDKPQIPGIAIGQDDKMAEGSSIELKCVPPLLISSAGISVTCRRQEDGKYGWMPLPTVECAMTGGNDNNMAGASIGLIVGIIVGVLVLVAIVIVVVVVVMKSRRDSGSPGKPPVSAPGSRDVIINAEKESGQDNQGHRGTADPPSDPQRRSYQQSQERPMDMEDVNFTEYSDTQPQMQYQPQPQQPGHSEVV